LPTRSPADPLTRRLADLLALRLWKVKSFLMSAKSPTTQSARSRRDKTLSASPITLAIDIGGTGLKAMLLDPKGKAISERLRVPTPTPASPQAVLNALDGLQAQLPGYDRVSVGFPGVTKRGVTFIAVNLHPGWAGFRLQDEIEKRWKKPARVANDAAVQGYGAVKGEGVEMIVTLGTGMGSSLFTDGRLCPGLELGHHPWHKKTYEDYLGLRGLRKYGKKRWNKLLQEAIAQTAATFNWDRLYIGGGNAKKISFDLPPNVKVVSNEDGLLGGVALWNEL
jgi:polyphosphate glucokinase